MFAQDLSDACGTDPGWLCRIVHEQTEWTWGAALISVVATVGFVLLLAFIVSRLIKRNLPRATKAYTDRREADVDELEAAGLTDQQRVDRALQVDRSRQRAETLGAVLASVLAGLAWFVAVLLILDQVGLNLAPLLAGAGVVGVALGFGAQQMVRDFLAGIFIVFEDQYGVGDVVDLGEATGSVEQVNLRATRLRDVNGVVWYVPNGEIRRVGNMSKLWSRAVLDIEVGYETDVDAAGALMVEVAEALRLEHLPSMSILEPPEYWGVERFGADGVALRLVVRTEPTEQWATARELRGRIKTAFEAAGIDIPYPQRTVHIRRDD